MVLYLFEVMPKNVLRLVFETFCFGNSLVKIVIIKHLYAKKINADGLWFYFTSNFDIFFYLKNEFRKKMKSLLASALD